MKKAKKLLLSVVMLLTLGIAAAGFGMNTYAAVKTVKNRKFNTTRTTRINNDATVVKIGSAKLKVKQSGYLKFKVPSTRTYVFTLSGQRAADGNYNNGFAYIMRPKKDSYSRKYYFDHLTFTTAGGKATTAYFNSRNTNTGEKTTYSYLTKRNCKLKLKKGQTIFVYIYFGNPGTINLTIK